MTERDQPPYPAGYHPVPDDDWRENTTPGLPPVQAPGSSAFYGSTGYGRPSVDQPHPYEQPRYPDPGYGQSDYPQSDYEQSRHGEPGYGQAHDGEPGYGRSDYGQSRYGEPGYGRSSQPGYGEPGYGDPGYGPPGASAAATAPAYSTRPVAVRRPDALAALALLVAGILAAASLLVTWLANSEATGWTLLRDAFRDLGDLFGTGMWQPLAIIVGGGLLFLLGLLALVPARAHRTVGVLALLVTGAVGAGVVVPLLVANWKLTGFDLGFFLGIAVAVLGLIGSLKALITGPRLTNRTPATY